MPIIQLLGRIGGSDLFFFQPGQGDLIANSGAMWDVPNFFGRMCYGIISCMNKKPKVTTIIEQDDDGYVARCPELGVVGCGDTEEESRKNLVKAIKEYLKIAGPGKVP